MGRRTNKNYIQNEMFAELMESGEQALAYERGARDGYRVAQVESPKPPRQSPVGEAVSPKTNPASRRKHKNAADK